MLNTCFLKKAWLLAFLWSLQFYFWAFSKCSSRSLCSDRKSHSNGLLIYVYFVQSSVVHIAPSGYVITFEFLIKHFPFLNMWETIANWIDFFLKNGRVFYFTLAFLCVQGLFLIYLLLALFIHRKDRKELERIAISRGVDVLFKYSWRGVELEISHPRSKRTPAQGNQPPSPPLGDWAGEMVEFASGSRP